jgi:hypothetical protein
MFRPLEGLCRSFVLNHLEAEAVTYIISWVADERALDLSLQVSGAFNHLPILERPSQ